jgi:hypothetical protein
MTTVQRVPLPDEVAELVSAARGTNEVYRVLEIASDDGWDISMAEAIEVCRRVAAGLPRDEDNDELD